jgi:hypothetical protein
MRDLTLVKKMAAGKRRALSNTVVATGLRGGMSILARDCLARPKGTTIFEGESFVGFL